MIVAFRADSSASLGHGHIMRCLALADELRKRGAESHFLCQSRRGHAGNRVIAQGHRLHLLPQASTTELDAQQSLAEVESIGCADWMVVDHYSLDAAWQQAVRMEVPNILVIGGIPDRIHDCTLLHDQNLVPNGEALWRRLCPESTRLLLGPRYALLRPEFRAARNLRDISSEPDFDLLIAFGATDPTAATVRILEAIDSPGLSNLNLAIVVGSSNHERDRIKALAAQLPKAALFTDTREMGRLFAMSRRALLAGGVQVLEGMCVGVPIAVWPQVENQRHAIKGLEEAGVCWRLDVATSGATLRDDLQQWLRDDDCESMAIRGRNLVDGRGAQRVADAMAGSSVAASEDNLCTDGVADD